MGGNLASVKLCRFELISSPTQPRSGIVYGSKVYETDGANPVGVHTWDDVRLLSPIGLPPSIRLFGPPDAEADWDIGPDTPLPSFDYINPSILIGPGLTMPLQLNLKTILVDSCLGIIVGGGGRGVSADQADGLVLGLTLVASFYAPTEPGGRSRDVGFAIGPAITTPDELDDAVTEDERGRRYRFSLGLKVNSEEIFLYDLNDLPHTPAEYLSYASETAALRQGDVVAISLQRTENKLERGDHVQVVSEKLGALSTRLS